MALRPKSLATPWLSGSTESRTLGNHSVRERLSQPASATADAAAAARPRNARLPRRLRNLNGLFMGGLDTVAAGDHRSQVVPQSRYDHLEHVDEHERDQQPRDDEMDRARRLPAAD